MPDPRCDDHVLFKRFANRSRKRGAHGGQLFVTNKGVTFRPHWFDRMTVKAPTVVVPWTQIASIDVVRRGKAATWPGGLRRRLRIVRHDGTYELFIVNRVESVRGRLGEIQRTMESEP